MLLQITPSRVHVSTKRFQHVAFVYRRGINREMYGELEILILVKRLVQSGWDLAIVDDVNLSSFVTFVTCCHALVDWRRRWVQTIVNNYFIYSVIATEDGIKKQSLGTDAMGNTSDPQKICLTRAQSCS